MQNNLFKQIKIGLILFGMFAINAHATLMSGSVHVDNLVSVYISTDDTIEGTLLASGTDWTIATAFTNFNLATGTDYFLHVFAEDAGGRAGFIGDFSLTGTDHLFVNGLSTITTNPTDWVVNKTGWGIGNVAATSLGVNGISPSCNDNKTLFA